MTVAVDIYKNGIKLATGTATAASASVASVSAVNSRVIGPGRNVQVTPTAGNNIGAVMNTRVIVDGGSSITMSDKLPFS